MSKGLVYIFTGEGKGKTSAALGMTLRARCANLKVAWLAWYKDPSWDVSEYQLGKLLGVDLWIGGKGFYFPDKTKVKPTNVGVVVDKASSAEHKQAAQLLLKQAQTLLQSQSYDLMILDEICQAAGEGLIEIKALTALMSQRGKTHLVLTGRNCPARLIKLADTVTEMKKLKHAYDYGQGAVRGLDF